MYYFTVDWCCINLSWEVCINLVMNACHHSIYLSCNPGGPFANSELLNSYHGKVMKSITKCGMKLFIHSQTSTVALLTFGNGSVISAFTLLDMWSLTYAATEVLEKQSPCLRPEKCGQGRISSLKSYLTKWKFVYQIHPGEQYQNPSDTTMLLMVLLCMFCCL